MQLRVIRNKVASGTHWYRWLDVRLEMFLGPHFEALPLFDTFYRADL